MMKVKFGSVTWDRIDEDRWITAAIATMLFLLLALFVFKSIRIPENITKVTFTEDMEFLHLDPEQKAVQKNMIEEILPKSSTIDLEIILPSPIPYPYPDPYPDPNPPVPFPDPIVKPKPFIEVPMPIVPSPIEPKPFENDIDPYKPPEPSPSDLDDPYNLKVKDISQKPRSHLHGQQRIKLMKTGTVHNSDSDFPGNNEDIIWEPLLDPIFEWMRKNSCPMGIVPSLFLTNKDQTARYSKTIIWIDGVQYELILASKEEKRELIICMINLETKGFVRLTDIGLIQSSNVFSTGMVGRNGKGEIISFSKVENFNANHEKAREMIAIFYQWAKSEVGKN